MKVTVAEMRDWCISKPYELHNGCPVVSILTEPGGAAIAEAILPEQASALMKAVRLYVRQRRKR